MNTHVGAMYSDIVSTHEHTWILLSTHTQAENFHPEYFVTGNMIVNATMEVYKQTMLHLLPTPAKSHYVFNLRDFARVVLGCLLIKPQCVESKKTFVKLWVHEVWSC